jgi:hypothetical protein
MGVSSISNRQNISRYSVSGKVLVMERIPATSLFDFCSFPSSDGAYIIILD